jgi:hypothetical protein
MTKDEQRQLAKDLINLLRTKVLAQLDCGRVPIEQDLEDNIVILKQLIHRKLESLPNFIERK